MAVIGVIGLPKSGKSTVFNAVTRGHAQTGPFHVGGVQPNVGVAKVPDPRLLRVAEIERSRRIVPAEVEFIDIPGGSEGADRSRGIGGESLNVLQRCDALALVVRAFDDPSVPHVEETIDPYRDVATMGLEMAFSDMAILERREERVQASMKGAKAAERDALLKEASLVKDIREGLEAEVPVREQVLPTDAGGVIENFHLLTAKPLFIVFNVGEDGLPRLDVVDGEVRDRLARPKVDAAAMCGKLEMELAQMATDEEAEFRASLGAGEPALERIVRLSYGVLDLVTFLTAAENEARAWSITQGTTAQQAAGKIHTDLQRGFIRAEVVAFDDLNRVGSVAEARRHGLLRAEGKGYVVHDGDVILFLFNV